ncbi:asparagine synthase (glutamine-hydrolyzing) [Chryseobacterium sp.]|uniref:asparagine synthase (glutamine-hydrolyzing) n=1 Tax=Chryseobacterium sp. TaxID=1871047 RepID=UPI0025B83038|nr:asparagine synthase (glutamine-hydrolyzing) [Chryseobacterium sp.]MBV8328647.1 asparagine synthase (glutamine-hydrolyzing) [Chryseobacterium sp.]
MCGINGILAKNKDIQKVQRDLELMNQKIFHRGPDEDGFFVDDIDGVTLGFAMRRLSIIDLSSGKQPIFSDDKTKLIVFNGEIYNYRELKEDLISSGYQFHTKSDTEVILKLYEKYGVEGFKMLDGMFGFSILDKTKGKVYIARDFFGEKPLYYFSDENNFVWGSELKSLISVLPVRPEISNTGLNLFFQLTYIPAPYTIYKNIHKLEANHYIELDIKNLNCISRQISERPENPAKINVGFDEAKLKVRELVEKSVNSRSVSDVPIGTFLSGGVDSSIVTWSLAKTLDQKINTFSIGFEKKSFDETDRSQLIAKLIKSDHHEFIVGEKDFSDNLHEILLNFDEPFADSSALPSFLVAHKTSQYVKVALTGDGGDEVFGGYNKYLIGKINQRYTGLVSEKIHHGFLKMSDRLLAQKEDNRGLKFKVKKALDSISYKGDFFYNIIKLGFQRTDLNKILKPEYVENSGMEYYKTKLPYPKNLSDFREVDKIMSLEGDMLVKVDRTSMLTSLESRAPFLNKEIWDYTKQLPENFLIKGNSKKYILKKAFEEFFPDGFLEKTKKGFGVPVGDWMKSGLKEELLSYAAKEKIESQNIFEYREIDRLISNHLNGIQDNAFKVWTFYCFQKWYFMTYSQK